jgi:hypothetical protein
LDHSPEAIRTHLDAVLMEILSRSASTAHRDLSGELQQGTVAGTPDLDAHCGHSCGSGKSARSPLKTLAPLRPSK